MKVYGELADLQLRDIIRAMMSFSSQADDQSHGSSNRFFEAAKSNFDFSDTELEETARLFRLEISKNDILAAT